MKYTKFIFMLVVILIFIFLTIFCNGCTGENSKKELKIKDNEGADYLIVRIKNHQYLKYDHANYRFSICHYEDCDYCMKNKEVK